LTNIPLFANLLPAYLRVRSPRLVVKAKREEQLKKPIYLTNIVLPVLHATGTVKSQVNFMGTMKSKKEILDYLWEWAEKTGHWTKLLVKTVVRKQAPLSEVELTAIYDDFLRPILSPTHKAEPVEPPKLAFAPTDLILSSLSEIKGVNKLAENQCLNFSKNITVIYGENASGKSGYSRILKALGFSYDGDNKVLCNVYCSEKPSQNAKIDYILDGTPDQFVWDGACACPALQSIAVFTNNCVHISLDSKRELLVTPIGFHLFASVSDELDRLAAIHQAKITLLTQDISWLDELNEGTKVQGFLKELSHKSKKEDLETLAQFTDGDAEKLKTFEQEKRNLNKKLLETEITNLQHQLRELADIKLGIKTAQENFSGSDWEAMGEHLGAIEELKKTEQKSIKEIAEQRGIQFYESEEFANFIRAADDYLKKLAKPDYPADNDEICIYCRQKFSDQDARELLKSYRLLLNDPTQAQIKAHAQAFSALNTSLKNIDTNLAFHHASFGTNNENKPVQSLFLTEFCGEIKRLQKIAEFKSKTQIQGAIFAIEYNQVMEQLDQKAQSLTAVLGVKNKTLSTIEEAERKLDQEINELKDQQKLRQKYSEVDKILTGLKVANILEALSGSFSTDSLSRKTTQARNDLIAENFADIFKDELKRLRRSNVGVTLHFMTDKAKSQILQNISSDYLLRDVLSEGEQKAIALAEFLTELQLDKSIAPVVFDDPVTSLDHKIIDEIARRLVNLSRGRQVVVFTHSILLFYSIKQLNESPRFKDLAFKYYETEADLENTGILYDTPNLKEDSFTGYEKKINAILHLPKAERDRREGELAIDGYNKLRPAIEVFVEKEILKDTVKRYRENVALTSLEKLNGALIDKHKERLTHIFDKSCGYIDAHSSPGSQDGVQNKPTLTELKIDFDGVCEIRKEFIN
jgi:hypothetical protein